jgi:S-DNA-T family DNA segregation ATPase FtsK/SpoIIIE
VAFWLGLAHGLGAAVRRVGHSARELDPEHRRDGAGLLLIALSVVVAAAVWWQLPGGVGDTTRTVVNGSVGLLGWFVPLVLLGVGAATMRNPESTGPVGRQVIGWGALVFGVLGLVHLANGSPEGTDTASLQSAGGAIGFVVGSLAMDLLQTPYVVVPIFTLVATFGLLVVTATPVYRIPERLGALRDRVLGPPHPPAPEGAGQPPPSRLRRSSAAGPVAGWGRWPRATTSPPRATRPTTPR